MFADTTKQNLPLLPLAESSFHKLRELGKIYVDKTNMICELAKENNKIFLTRPRRFGKSLLISTFESLFQHGLRDFKGLAIEKLWKDKGKYSVLTLDFSLVSNYSDIEDFKTQLNNYLLDSMETSSLTNSFQATSSNGLCEFAKWLHFQPINSVVLLIDEYDAPLTSCLLDRRTFLKVSQTIATFYKYLSENSAAFRFLFLTGVTKFGKPDISSSLNDLVDISLMSEYGEILGFTLEELGLSFNEYIKYSTDILNLSESDLIRKLDDTYNGFCFEETATKTVFSPWSVLNFLKRPSRGFKPYWFDSGGQLRESVKYIKEHSLRLPDDFFQRKTVSISALSGSKPSRKTGAKNLLLQTGYLTIKERVNSTLYLGYPNQEVAGSMALLYLDYLLKGYTLEDVKAGDLCRILAKGDTKGFVDQINNAFLALDFERYFIRDKMSCVAIFLLVLLGSGIHVRPKIPTSLERSDIEFTEVGIYWVVGLEYARSPMEVPIQLAKGQAQIKERHYGEQSFEKRLIRLVMVFSEKERHFVKYKVVDSDRGSAESCAPELSGH